MVVGGRVASVDMPCVGGGHRVGTDSTPEWSTVRRSPTPARRMDQENDDEDNGHRLID